MKRRDERLFDVCEDSQREEINLEKLIFDFNNRKVSALVGVYNICHNELLFYTERLVATLDCEATDFLHDAIIKVWSNKSVVFRDIDSFKSYIYVAIRNLIFNYLDHNKCVESYAQKIKNNPDIFRKELSNSELLKEIYSLSDILPDEVSQIIKLILSGYEIKEIAIKLNKSESYVYKKRNEGIAILKKNSKILISLIVSSL